jgi:hypothetical protein
MNHRGGMVRAGTGIFALVGLVGGLVFLAFRGASKTRDAVHK